MLHNLKAHPSKPKSAALGLLILTVVEFVPYLGGLVHLGVVCLGVGAFAWQLYRVSRPTITA